MNSAPRYRDAEASAWGAAWALAVGIALDTYAIAYVSMHAEEGVRQPLGAWVVFHFLVRVATLMTFIAWVDRAYANISPLGGDTEHPRFWAALGFVVPPFCFFRPCQIVLETWRFSDPSPVSSSAARWIVTWWVLLMSGPMVVLSENSALPMDRPHYALIRHAVNVLAGCAAIFIVHRITSAQRQMHAMQALAAAAEERSARAAALRVAAVPAASSPGAPLPAAASAVATPNPVPFPRPAGVRRAPVAPRRMTRRLPLSDQFPVVMRWLTTRPARSWRDAGAWTAAAVGILTLMAGVVFLTQTMRRPVIAGATHIAFGALLLLSWLLLRRTMPADGEERRWMVLAAAVGAIALMNFLALSGALTR